MKLHFYLFIFLFPLISYSQSDSAISIQLSETIVTGKLDPSDAGNSLQKISIIDQKEIKRLNAQSLGDILNYQLGIRISNETNLGTSGSINGIGTKNIKILIDGIPIVGGLNGGTDLSQINLNSIERIEIIEGANAILFGSNSLGGIINLITKKSEKKNLRFISYVESVQRYNLSISNQAKLKKKIYLNTFLAHNYFNGFSRPDTTRVDQWKPKENIHFNFGIKKNLNTQSELFINSINSYEKLISRGLPFNAQQNLAEDIYYHTYNFLESIKFKNHLNTKSGFVVFGSSSYYKREKFAYIKNLSTLERSPSLNNFRNNIISSNNINSNYFYFINQKDQLQAGFDLIFSNAQGEKISNGNKQQNSYSLFLLPEFNLYKEKVSVKPGLRYNYIAGFKNPLLASLNTKFSPSKNFSLRFGIGNAYRVPSLSELYFEFVDNNHQIYGNPNLISESSVSADVSATYIYSKSAFLHKFEFSNNLNSITNLIGLVQYEPLRFIYRNISNMKTINNGLGYKLIAEKYFLEAGMNVNYIKIPDYNFNKAINNYQYKIAGSYTQFNWRINAIFKFDKNLPQFNQIDDQINLALTRPLKIMDISVDKSFLNNRLEASLGVKNLFDLVSVNSGTISSSNPHANGSNLLIGTGRTYFINLIWNILNEK